MLANIDDGPSKDLIFSNGLADRLEKWMMETNDPLLKGPVPAPVGAEINTRDQLSPDDPTTTVT